MKWTAPILVLAIVGCRSTASTPEAANFALPLAHAPLAEPKAALTQPGIASPPICQPGQAQHSLNGFEFVAACRPVAPTQQVLSASLQDEQPSNLAARVPSPDLDESPPRRQEPIPSTLPAPVTLAAAPPRELLSPAPATLPSPEQPITIAAAVRWALAANPDLIVQREELGVAGAARDAAEVYPYNPTFEAQIQSADNSQGLRQHVRQSYSVLQEIELGGKGSYRRAAADAALDNTQWGVRQREREVVAEVYRKFEAALLARRKLELLRETTRVNERLAADSRQLRDAGRLTGGDVLIAEAEASDARQAELQAGSEQQLAQLELRALLGMSDNTELLPDGELNLPPVADPAGQELVASALENQPELQAKAAALAQADAAMALARANSVPDVTAGPAFEYDESKSYFVGATLQVPLQIFNRKQGELLQAEAEHARAAADLEQSRLKVKMRTVAAAQQFSTARQLADSLRKQLPASQQQVQDAEKLLAAGQVDLLKVVEVRRRNLALRQQLLDAESRAMGQLVELETLTGQLPLPSDERDHPE